MDGKTGRALRRHEREHRLLPTTRPQVSGHRFMQRRVEHGLIFGDIRMIHDPLAMRRRAMAFGLAAAVIVGAVMGLLAWLRPNADPGDAPILRASHGELFVRVDGAVHPVTNLTSARLITGAADNPVRVGDAHLVDLPRGVPVGLPAAPSHFAPKGGTAAAWSVCHAGETVTVAAGPHTNPLPPEHAVVAASAQGEWLVTAQGRALLPGADDPAGRVIRRALGITPQTPRWHPPAQVLSALRENPPLRLPDPLPELIQSEDEWWMLTPDRAVQQVTQVQAAIMRNAGAQLTTTPRAELANYPDAVTAVKLHLPEVAPQNWEAAKVCVGADRGAVDVEQGEATVRLSAGATATHFTGLDDGAVAVDTGHGYHVVSTHGLRHEVEDKNNLAVIGAERIEQAPWEIVSLLPEGDALRRQEALAALY
ncbi:type VII secretion protein EccB [Corynebacterium mayonis]|uniref:type VII secretion protein EccB n=1 Tax=Corynebacterium mayonis TaxID=3062461 RepID=UPI0031404769